MAESLTAAALGAALIHNPRSHRNRSIQLSIPPELWADLHSAQPALEPSELAGEMHARLVRSLSLPLLPLLAVPLGMASKRGRRAPGVVIACLMLLLLQQGVQIGESLAESGKVAAIPAVWGPLALFSAFSIWLFRASLGSPGENPVTRAVGTVEGLIGGINLRRKKPAAKAASR